jgi:hypothetical protein
VRHHVGARARAGARGVRCRRLLRCAAPAHPPFSGDARSLVQEQERSLVL